MIFSGGMVPLTYLEIKDDNGILIDVLTPKPEDTVEYVKSIVNGNLSFKEELENFRSEYEGDLWFEDHLEEYRKLFGLDIIER